MASPSSFSSKGNSGDEHNLPFLKKKKKIRKQTINTITCQYSLSSILCIWIPLKGALPSVGIQSDFCLFLTRHVFRSNSCLGLQSIISSLPGAPSAAWNALCILSEGTLTHPSLEHFQPNLLLYRE